LIEDILATDETKPPQEMKITHLIIANDVIEAIEAMNKQGEKACL